MITFFQNSNNTVIAVEHNVALSSSSQKKLCWLFGSAKLMEKKQIDNVFIGPRKVMITPWSTNAVEITRNMGIEGIERIEEFFPSFTAHPKYDPMLQESYHALTQELFSLDITPEPVKLIEDIEAYNKAEGLALSAAEIDYLHHLSKKLQRPLTDSEVFGFSQVNSEHCRHKIFNGRFIIDGEIRSSSLFDLIKRTSKEHPNFIVSAYKDNVAFIAGPSAEEFAPQRQDVPDFFRTRTINTVISLKAETHNFPTTVEPFNGAATGTGGEIRDRLAGGKGSLPIAGTAVYMTPYSRTTTGRTWEMAIPERSWRYQTPADILIKASNGASDFGNKYGQPLVCGSLLTFEHFRSEKKYSYDKVIMLAGGVGYGNKRDAQKEIPQEGNLVIVMGGDNYRIGMGGSAVSSVDTGEYGDAIERNAIQRANPEMQKRVANVIRAMAESDINPIVSIHDHGAGGHLNSLSELLEQTGGVIEIDKLPLGDPTLSAKEIIGNESQERMGLIIRKEDLPAIQKIALRERAPLFVVGEVTNDMKLRFIDTKKEIIPINLDIKDLFGETPHTVMQDVAVETSFKEVEYNTGLLHSYLEKVLQIEAVACKDWLTNKVDRSVTGRIAKQQCTGAIQLPLNNVAVVTADYQGTYGIANAIGHAPVSGLVNPGAASRLSVTEALTNIIWAPLTHGIKGVSLSANWMWPCNNKGEDTRLYHAVQAISDFAVALGINIPTGKDSLSMTQKYPDGKVVFSPGTVIVSAAAETNNIRKIVSPDIKPVENSKLIYIDLSKGNFALGGSSFAQICNAVGKEVPDVEAGKVKSAFEAIQLLITNGCVVAGHDISAGGMITTLLEMTFPCEKSGMALDLDAIKAPDIIKLLFSEQPGVILQVVDERQTNNILQNAGVSYEYIGMPSTNGTVTISRKNEIFRFDIPSLRDTWFTTSFLFDKLQSGHTHAKKRYNNYKEQPLHFRFSDAFKGTMQQYGLSADRNNTGGIRAAIIREKGVNGDREMAYSLFLAGFDVKDVHMTDLINGRETLEDINIIVFVGGFSNSDVLGSAKGWAGAFLFNEKAKMRLDNFYKRDDTLSLGVCNGCQLMVELGLIYPGHKQKPTMLHNDSKKFESAFITVDITDNQSVMLKTLSGQRLGIWVAHGEGKISLPLEETQYAIPAKYTYPAYPGTPNGSDYHAAAICSDNGRHLAIMPHLERSIFPWQWAHYPYQRPNDEVSPWIEAFVNARKWIEDLL